MKNGKKIHLTSEERSKYAADFKKITGWATSKVIEDGSEKYGRIPYTFQELQDEAVVGFCKALDTYTTNSGANFLSYSYTCMRNEMLSYIRKNNNKRYAEVKAYYESIGAIDKLRDDENEWERVAKKKDYEIKEDDYRMIKYNSIEVIRSANLEGVIDYIESNLNKNGLFVFDNYINPKGDFKPKMSQKEIAKELSISQPAVSKTLKKIEELVLKFINCNKNLEVAYYKTVKKASLMVMGGMNL